jgi:hypothetical protein
MFELLFESLVRIYFSYDSSVADTRQFRLFIGGVTYFNNTKLKTM